MEIHAVTPIDILVLNQPLCASGIAESPASASVPKVYWFISPWAAEWKASNPESHFVSRMFNMSFRNRMEDLALQAAQGRAVPLLETRLAANGELEVHGPAVAGAYRDRDDNARYTPDHVIPISADELSGYRYVMTYNYRLPDSLAMHITPVFRYPGPYAMDLYRVH